MADNQRVVYNNECIEGYQPEVFLTIGRFVIKYDYRQNCYLPSELHKLAIKAHKTGDFDTWQLFEHLEKIMSCKESSSYTEVSDFIRDGMNNVVIEAIGHYAIEYFNYLCKHAELETLIQLAQKYRGNDSSFDAGLMLSTQLSHYAKTIPLIGEDVEDLARVLTKHYCKIHKFGHTLSQLWIVVCANFLCPNSNALAQMTSYGTFLEDGITECLQYYVIDEPELRQDDEDSASEDDHDYVV